MECRTAFRLNGQAVEVPVEAGERLIDLLRDRLDLTGTKEGCGEGECGACTVLVDGRPVLSCLTAAASVNGREVLTVEGLGRPERLHPLQRAFLEEWAVQCGFCIPGVLLSAKALLDRNPRPTEWDVRVALAGNLCRCTGYSKIVKAVLAAAEEIGTSGQ